VRPAPLLRSDELLERLEPLERLELASFLTLGVADVRFDAFDQFRRHLANAVFLGVLTRFLKYFLYCLTSHDVLTSTRGVYLRAFQHLCHGLPP
jgi:hypothetical protein